MSEPTYTREQCLKQARQYEMWAIDDQIAAAVLSRRARLNVENCNRWKAEAAQCQPEVTK